MRCLFLFLMLVSSIPAFAQVPMQTTQDKAEGKRLTINGKPLFISGMNIAWNSYGNEAGDSPVQIDKFVNQFKQIKSAGGNAVRWWLHADMRSEPKINSNGEVTRIGTKTIDNIRQVLDSAYNYGIVVSICLFAHGMLTSDGKDATTVANNKKFLTDPTKLDTYINTVLKPILEAVGNHPAVMCWEVFNEPEGMTSDAGGWTDGAKIEMSDVLRITARIAAVIHDKTLKLASTGVHEFGKMKKWYSDAALKTAAGSDPLASKAYLDFYMAHYYPEYGGTSESPFHNTASSWGMDRPVLIGEFPAQSWDGSNGYGSIQSGTAMNITAAYEYAYDNGYCGAMSWSMTDGEPNKFGTFNTTKPALENLYAKHKADINIKDVEIVVPTGDLAMKVVITSLPATDPKAELGKEGSLPLSGKTNLTFDMYIAPGSGTNMKVVPVLKIGDAWTWSPATSYAIDLSTKTAGEWFTVSIPISNSFIPESGSFDASKVKAFLFQFQPSSSPYTGTIYIDNVKADGTLLYGFNEIGNEWSATKWVNDANAPVQEIAVSLAQRPGEENPTPVANHSPLATSHSPSYYTIKGEPLGNAKPQKAGIYIVKQGSSIKKIAVR